MTDDEHYPDEAAPPLHVANVERKQELVSSREVNCGYCQYHKGENATRRSRNANPRKQGRSRRRNTQDS